VGLIIPGVPTSVKTAQYLYGDDVTIHVTTARPRMFYTRLCMAPEVEFVSMEVHGRSHVIGLFG
jgi:uncharacterized pyridoxamine 5'-phosphate oxidase family protein